jgi:hypothetical protein
VPSAPQDTSGGVWLILAAYVIGLVASALLLKGSFGYFEVNTDTHADAVGAFITVCAVTAGLFPLGVLPLITVRAALKRRRETRSGPAGAHERKFRRQLGS